MANINLETLLTHIDIHTGSKEHVLEQIVVAYCNEFDISKLEPQTVTDQLLRLSQSAAMIHNNALDKSQKHLKWNVPKEIEPFQLALYLSKNISDITDVLNNEVDFMRLVWDYAIGYSKQDINKVKNEIIRLEERGD